MRILLVEDDPVLGQGLEVLLKLNGHETLWRKDLASVSLEEQYDLAILDISLPDGNGIDLAQKLRSLNPKIPLIFLTAIHHEEVLLKAFRAGASDYVKKPFSNRELLARISACTQMTSATDGLLNTKDFEINLREKSLKYRGRSVDISLVQLKILYCFLKNVDEVLGRDQILSFLKKDGEIFDRTIDSHISLLRKTLKKHEITDVHIKSVYGVGHKLSIYN